MCIEFIKEDILKAFKNVQLEDGIGLWEAQAIDDYETKDEQARVRKKDEKKDWTSINGDDLFRCDSSLSFMDPKGMRFHLPAFILGEIEGVTNTSPMYHLTHVVISRPELFIAFNPEQKEAVAKYLDWCIWQEDYKFHNNQIKRALNEFWRKN